jgi:hypothetical protein
MQELLFAENREVKMEEALVLCVEFGALEELRGKMFCQPRLKPGTSQTHARFTSSFKVLCFHCMSVPLQIIVHYTQISR